MNFYLSSPEWGAFSGYSEAEAEVIKAAHLVASLSASYASWFGAWLSPEMERQYAAALEKAKQEHCKAFNAVQDKTAVKRWRPHP